jgi:hypothetical protein
MKKAAALILALATVSGISFASERAEQSCRSPEGESSAAAEARLREQLLVAGLRYARDHTNPRTGFVEDTVGNFAPLPPSPRIRASISSTGFMMALVADLYTKGMVSREEAFHFCERPLRAVLAKKASDRARAGERARTGAPDPHTDISYQGWFAHFIDWETGDRWIDTGAKSGVEYATTDSTWFLSGGIVCAEAFPGTAIPRQLNEILSAVNFRDLLTDGGRHPNKQTLSMAWRPEEAADPEQGGYSKAQWDKYQHSWLVVLLGLGAPREEFRLPLSVWAGWGRTGDRLSLPGSFLDGKILYGDRRALFSHYFPDVFLPPQEIHEACGIDYFENSRLATVFNRETALGDSSSATFRAGLWGLDAGPNPVVEKLTRGLPLSPGEPDNTRYGVNSPFVRNGTACPACALATAMFAPHLALMDLRTWCDDPVLGPWIWGKYGPANGINLDYGWVSPYALSGIVGPMALSVANLDWATSVWRLFRRHPVVQAGLRAAAGAPLPDSGCLRPE